MIEDWALRGLQRWPNVPAVFGWLGLDRRGRWLIRGEAITRPQIIETIGRNYAPDAQGRWYFQNGPQRGYVTLEALPLILRMADVGDGLVAHTDETISCISEAFLDEQGALMLNTDLGPGLLLDSDLLWALERLAGPDGPVDERGLADALAEPSGAATMLSLAMGANSVAVRRLNSADAPGHFGFVRDPQPFPAAAVH